MNNEQKVAVRTLAKIIIETVKEFGYAPSTSIYLALNKHGISLSQYQSIMDTLVKHGFLVHEYDTYSATGKIL